MVFQSDRKTIILLTLITVGAAVIVEARANDGAVACLLVPLPPQSPVVAEATLEVWVDVFEAKRQKDAGDEGGGDIESRSPVH